MQQPEDVISVDGFTYHVDALTEKQKLHVADIRNSDMLLDQKKFEAHVLENYRNKLVDELGEMLKEDGKK
tara:strand:- start:119 stop:328 length:210 start_codon:yes stop_codon:yes gene_type:complete